MANGANGDLKIWNEFLVGIDCNVESQQNHCEKTSPFNTSNVPKNQQESQHLPNFGCSTLGALHGLCYQTANVTDSIIPETPPNMDHQILHLESSA